MVKFFTGKKSRGKEFYGHGMKNKAVDAKKPQTAADFLQEAVNGAYLAIFALRYCT